MEDKSPSITAEDMAGHRAFEMLRPKHERICEDPYARHFVNDRCEKALKYPLLGKFMQWMIQKIHPGGPDAVIARARFIDDYIKTCVKEGLEQLVILGAGYDCRPYRMNELKNGISVFELDHTSTQEIKLEKLTSILGHTPDHVVFVPYKINERGLENILTDTGYDPLKNTLFIMEGLVMYLPIEAFKNILLFVSQNSGPGSSVVFDFLPPGIDDGTIELKVGKTLHNYAKKRGEPFQFGIDKTGIEKFLSENGFYQIQCISAEECRPKYFNGANQMRKISPLFSFAHAEIETS